MDAHKRARPAYHSVIVETVAKALGWTSGQ